MTDALPPRVPPRRLIIGFGSLVLILMVGGAVSFVRYADSRSESRTRRGRAVRRLRGAAGVLDRWRVGRDAGRRNAPAPRRTESGGGTPRPSLGGGKDGADGDHAPLR